MPLYQRRYTLAVGQAQTKDTDDEQRASRAISALNIEFEVNKSAEPYPDSCVVKLFNPPEDIRQEAQQPDAAMRLEAGYEESTEIIFEGLIRKATLRVDGVDTILSIECGDTDGVFRSARVAQAFPKNTSLAEIGEQLMDKLGDFFNGNISTDGAKKLLKDLMGPSTHRTGKDKTAKGVSYTGSAAENFTKFLDQYNIQWTAQDNGIIRIAERDKASAQFPDAVLLKPETGLIGSPEQGEDGILKCRSLLQAGLKPFRQVEIQGFPSVNGSYVIDKVKHIGQFFGNEWVSEFEAIKIS